jgi:hypothetical protein
VRGVVRLAAGSGLALALAACGGSGSGGNSGDGGSSGGDLGPVQQPASLVAEVGENDAFEITLTDPDGNDIQNLAAGDYDVKVEDHSSIHNFHLTGNGVSESTTVGEKTETTWHITFKPGDYTFVCDPHSSTMNGDFHVT